MSTQLTIEWREEFWDRLAKVLENINDMNSKAELVQSAIAMYGPVPNSRGEKVRSLLKHYDNLQT